MISLVCAGREPTLHADRRSLASLPCRLHRHLQLPRVTAAASCHLPPWRSTGSRGGASWGAGTTMRPSSRWSSSRGCFRPSLGRHALHRQARDRGLSLQSRADQPMCWAAKISNKNKSAIHNLGDTKVKLPMAARRLLVLTAWCVQVHHLLLAACSSLPARLNAGCSLSCRPAACSTWTVWRSGLPAPSPRASAQPPAPSPSTARVRGGHSASCSIQGSLAGAVAAWRRSATPLAKHGR